MEIGIWKHQKKSNTYVLETQMWIKGKQMQKQINIKGNKSCKSAKYGIRQNFTDFKSSVNLKQKKK